MKKDGENSKTTKTDFPNSGLKLNELFESEKLSNAKNDSRNNDYKDIKDFYNIISNRIEQYTSENINLLLMLNRAYYGNQLVKIERYLDTLEYMNSNCISKIDEKRLIFCFNKLSKLEYLYVSLEDYYKTLQLQKRIINYAKKNIIITLFYVVINLIIV